MQNNISFNDEVGVTWAFTRSRGTSSSRSRPVARLARGWICARDPRSARCTTIIDPSVAVFVPKGVVSDAGFEHGVHIPGERSLVPGREVHVPELG